MFQDAAQMARIGQLSLLAARLEARCMADTGWRADEDDDELFNNYVALYALSAAAVLLRNRVWCG
jgi:hypothetical protein